MFESLSQHDKNTTCCTDPTYDNGRKIIYNFNPKGLAEASQIFLQNAHVLPKLLIYGYTADVIGGSPTPYSRSLSQV
jgi:hypothetical protein